MVANSHPLRSLAWSQLPLCPLPSLHPQTREAWWLNGSAPLFSCSPGFESRVSPAHSWPPIFWWVATWDGMALSCGLTSVRGNRGESYENEPLVRQKHKKTKEKTPLPAKRAFFYTQTTLTCPLLLSGTRIMWNVVSSSRIILCWSMLENYERNTVVILDGCLLFYRDAVMML